LIEAITNTRNITIHEFYKLTKKAMVKKRILRNPKDAFDEFLQHKQTYKSKREKLEEARVSGSTCPLVKALTLEATIKLNGNATHAESGLGSIKARAEVHVHHFPNILTIS